MTINKFDLAISKKLSLIRKEKLMTQAELAYKLQKHRSYISKVELGKRVLTFSELKEYCKVLSLDMQVFLED